MGYSAHAHGAPCFLHDRLANCPPIKTSRKAQTKNILIEMSVPN